MKTLLLIPGFMILMSSFVLAATLSISPGTLSLSGKANEDVCGNLILKYSSSGNVEGTDLWADEGTEKRLNLYDLEAEDFEITIDYPTQVPLERNVNKEIEVCVTAQDQGIFQGALYFVPVSSSGNQAPGVGTWLSVNIEGESTPPEEPDTEQFIANQPKIIDKRSTNKISLEITTTETVSGNVNIINHEDIINPGLTGVGYLIDITADTEIVNKIDEAIIKRYYDEDEIISENIDESSLKLYYYNPGSSQWEELTSIVNTNDNYVQTTITHFSIYGVFGDENENPDSDGDGVDNDADVCPDTPAGETVNSEGCSCSQLVVDDGNVCTDDSCTDGIVTHTNNNAECGYTRDCSVDGCSGTNWLDYPDDGHDYCSAGSCNVYSCAAISSTPDADCNTDDDADDDGVIDSSDSCPDTPAGETANSEGCSCSQLVVDDGNVCTDDSCNNGIVTHTNNNAQCGYARDCQSDGCSGRKWIDYPDDGNDYCSAGECNVYSCASISSRRRSECNDDDDESSSSSNEEPYTQLMATVAAGSPPDCTENWKCESWSKCINKKQTRTCEDKNKCSTIKNKPAESRSCIIQNLPTGEVIANTKTDKPSSVSVGILIISSIVISGLLVYLLIVSIIAYTKKK